MSDSRYEITLRNHGYNRYDNITMPITPFAYKDPNFRVDRVERALEEQQDPWTHFPYTIRKIERDTMIQLQHPRTLQCSYKLLTK